MKKLSSISMILLLGLVFIAWEENSCNCGTIEEKSMVNQPEGITWALKINWDYDKKTSLRNVGAKTGNSYSAGDYICL